jgi:O-antigen/teichoic acid export membrane protein
MSSFTKNIAITFSSRFFAAIFAALSTIIIARAFGPIGKGIFTMVAFFPSLALNLGHLGLGNANTYLIAQDKERTKKSFYNSFWGGLIIGWFFIIIFTLIYRFYPHEILGKGDIGTRYFLFSLITIPFILWENFYQGIFVGRQEFKFFNLISLFSKILLFVGLLILALVLKPDMRYSVFYYLFLMVFPAIIYSIYFLIHYGFPFELDKQIFFRTINFGIRSYLACLLAFLVLRSDIYFVNLFRGLQEVGLYSLAVGFGDGILLLVSSIALVLFPKITENQEQSLEITLKVLRIVSFLVGAIIIFSFVFGRWFIPLVFGESFRASLPAFYVLLPAIYFWAINNFLTQFFSSKGYPWKSVFLWFPGLLLNIILNIIYIPRYGIIAAALTSLSAYFVTFVLHYLYLQRFGKVSFLKILVPPKSEILGQLRKKAF